jgi:hypothetical protein
MLPISTANASSLSLNRLICNVYHDATQRTFSLRRNWNYLGVPFYLLFFSLSSGTPGLSEFQ